ncbi:hypothetical protein BJ741DRAFT_615163 [Chytriomyces cf. hyalinus JEL632]|nr:hypothetical protein BJ741DRAFT_615163 [Chytriomyces cf. hyalinus JEL632]
MSSSAHSTQSQPDARIEPPPIPASLLQSEPDSDSEDWENILRIKVELNSVSAQIFVEDSLVTWNLFVAKVIDLYRLPATCEITASYTTSDDGVRVLINTDAHLSALWTLDPIPRLSIHVSSSNDSPTLSTNNSNTDTLPLKWSRIDSEPVSVASLLLDLEGRVDTVRGGGDQRIPDAAAAVVADTMEFGGLNAVLDERAPVPELGLKGPRLEEENGNVGLKLSNDESVWRRSRRDEGGDDDGRKCPNGFEEVLFAVVIALFAWWMLR